jgi:hypothetical protein
VSIKDGSIHTIWDVDGAPEPYNEVASKLHEIVGNAQITGVFRTPEGSYGAEKTRDTNNPEITWHHFYGKVDRKFKTSIADAERGRIASIVDVFSRGLDKIRVSDLDEVLSLIDRNDIYRGQEHKLAVQEFRKAKVKYDNYKNKNLFAWEFYTNKSAGFKNTAIGTLLIDLADGDSIEVAVRKFEAKVAGPNYKRPTALITPRMIKDAMATINQLDLEGAIERRFANIRDISVNDVLFVDNSVIRSMKGGIADLLMQAAAPPKINMDKVTPIDIDSFMGLGASSISLVLRNSQMNKFVSLTAPVHSDVNQIFKWSNNYAWSYYGELTDSIRERVKKAGGNVTNAKLRCSLAWSNYDDLDIHCDDPRGIHIYYGSKLGILDVDMNGGHGTTREPVENLSWKTIQDGDYKISVNQFNCREHVDFGCSLQVEFDGKLYDFSYPKKVVGKIHMLDLVVKNGALVDIKTYNGVKGGKETPKEKWGVSTNVPIKVNTIMLSPNYWEGAGSIGNKHWFFMLDKCQNPDPVRGIYNEFLIGHLEKHRKVFEVLGSQTKCQPVPDQLSGVGFSSTMKDKVLAIADGRTYEISF